jgi:hypothetical protein
VIYRLEVTNCDFKLGRALGMDLSRIVTGCRIKQAPNIFTFTALGVAMLSGALNSKWAIQANVAIMRVL